MRRLFLPTLFLWTVLVPAFLASQDFTSESRIDWQTNSFAIELRGTIPSSSPPSASALHRLQTRLDQEFPAILFESLLPMAVDSKRIIEDAVREDPDLASQIALLAESAERDLPRPSTDLRSVSRTYRVPLFPDISRLFVTHTVPFQMERVVRWVPTREFTGIVIYAADPLPVHGSSAGREETPRTHLVPALLPQIYDTNLRAVLERDMVDPETLRTWGMVHYTEATTPDAWRRRAGTQPLQIMARRVYGVIPTDIMISPEDADRILASPENRQLLREGRIVVIVAPDRIDQLQ
jgi:hypothetical protein